MAVKALYIHIPFCNHICSYCDFCKVFYDQIQVDLYLQRLKEELQTMDLAWLQTIYIGGGTPSSLSLLQLKRLMEMLKDYQNHLQEMTIEVNPESMSLEKLKVLKAGGVNRLSIGVQTFQEHLLPLIDRHHCNQDVINTINGAKKVGISNISIDMMYGLPQQTIDDVKKDLQVIQQLEITHLSYYSLILEDHTVLKNKDYQPLDEEQEYQMNCVIDQTLAAIGLEKYEVSNYAKEGYQSMHNLTYWHYQDYLGAGIGAIGKVDGMFLQHHRSLSRYLKGDNELDKQSISQDDQMFEHIMMSLRLKEGLNIKDFDLRYNVSLLDKYHEAIDKHVKYNRLEINDGYLRVQGSFIYMLNEILLDFL